MTQTINDRIEVLVEERFGGAKASFCRAVGLGPSGLSNYTGEARRSKIPVDLIQKIVKELDVDAYWLLFGESRGECVNATQSAVTIGSGSSSVVIGDGAGNVERNKLLAEIQGLRRELTAARQTISDLRSQLADKKKIISYLEARNPLVGGPG